MRWIRDWKWVLTQAWSVQLLALAAILSGLEVTVQVMIAFTIDPHMPAGLFAALAGLTTVAATIARFVAQRPES